MKKPADDLREILQNATLLLEKISDIDASGAAAQDKWSKKQILGHLVDSASNNQQKFIRAMAEERTEFVGYAQNHWVDSQKYNLVNWSELVTLWRSFNLHIAHIIENVDPDLLSNTISIDGSEPFTLKFIMTDYNEHLKTSS